MRYTAEVVLGRGEGKQLGFPTLNLKVPEGFDARHGVYAGKAWIDGAEMPAAIHYGPAPVYGVKTPSLEVHIIGAAIPQAPQKLDFELVQYLREVKDFKGPAELAQQIAADVAQALEALKGV